MILLVLAVLIALMYVLYRKCRNKADREEVVREVQVARELLQTQVEVLNITLQQVGDDLQNHIGQMLSVAHINLNMLEESQDLAASGGFINQANEMVSDSITGLRIIAKNIGDDFIRDFKLTENLSLELIRIRKTNRLATELAVAGEKYALGHEKEIVLFRISQEIINEVKRNSRATNIFVQLRYRADLFVMLLRNDGVDFEDISNCGENGKNDDTLAEIKRRAEIIGGNFVLRTGGGEGATIEIFLPVNNS